jgi:Tfp pilus assembly protein PilW
MTRLRRARQRDQRGAFSLTELVLVGVLSLIVLTMATTMLTTMTGFATETSNQNEAQLRARQSLDTAMRYLRNAVPLARCTRWSATTPSNVDPSNPSAMKHCGGLSAAVPAVNREGSDFVFYAYSADTDPVGSTVNSSRAPDRFTVTVTPGTPQGQLTIVRQRASTEMSMLAATCQVEPASCSGISPRPTDVWESSSTTIATLEVANGTPFSYIGKNGGTNPIDDEIRTVLVDLTVYYEGKPTPGYTCGPTTPCLNNKPRKQIAYNASASIRGAVYSDDKAGN